MIYKHPQSGLWPARLVQHLYDVTALLTCLRRLLTHFQVVFWVGMTLAVHVYLRRTALPQRAPRDVTGDRLWYWRTGLGVRHADYARSVVRRLVDAPAAQQVALCDRSQYSVHDRVNYSMVIREVAPHQPLGNTNVHHVTAVLDDRVAGRPALRLLGVGLHPGPWERLYCEYDCGSSPAGLCSVRAQAVILISGNHSDYVPDSRRKSLMDVVSIACNVPATDTPKHVTLVMDECGYSHNMAPVLPWNVQGVVAPPYELGVCVRPISMRRYPGHSPRDVTLWLEYLRLQGADGVHLYTVRPDSDLNTTLSRYTAETLRLVHVSDWSVFEDRLEHVVSDEAALNHCLLTNTMKYRYLLMTSPDHVPLLEGHLQNLKQLVRTEEFRSGINTHKGYKIYNQMIPESPRTTFIVKTHKTLAVTANYFIPLSHRPYYRMLDTNLVTTVSLNMFKKHKFYNDMKSTLDAAVRLRYN